MSLRKSLSSMDNPLKVVSKGEIIFLEIETHKKQIILFYAQVHSYVVFWKSYFYNVWNSELWIHETSEKQSLILRV